MSSEEPQSNVETVAGWYVTGTRLFVGFWVWLLVSAVIRDFVPFGWRNTFAGVVIGTLGFAVTFWLFNMKKTNRWIRESGIFQRGRGPSSDVVPAKSEVKE